MCPGSCWGFQGLRFLGSDFLVFGIPGEFWGLGLLGFGISGDRDSWGVGLLGFGISWSGVPGIWDFWGVGHLGHWISGVWDFLGAGIAGVSDFWGEKFLDKFMGLLLSGVWNC